MTALTFNQALTKYRSDQARDSKGRFTDEGKGRGGTTEQMAGTARELDHLLVTRYKRKPAAAAAALRAELQRLGTKVPAFKGGNRQLFREWLLGAVQLAGREKIMNAGLNTRPRDKWDDLDEARSRALDRTSSTFVTRLRDLDMDRRTDQSDEARATRLGKQEAVLRDMERASLPKAEWHAIARQLGVEVPSSSTGKWAREMAFVTLRDDIKFQRYMDRKAKQS
jgi:hypothetical protein